MRLIFIIYIFSLVFGLDCIDDIEISLWGKCYNVQETNRLNVSGASLSGRIPIQIAKLSNLIL